MEIINIIKAIVFGIIQGITEWLPISSTGHLIILNDLLKLVMEHDAKATAATAIKLVQIFAMYDEKVVKPIAKSTT